MKLRVPHRPLARRKPMKVSPLAGVTGLAVRMRSRRPYLLMGWLWYLGTLVPVVGLLQAGPNRCLSIDVGLTVVQQPCQVVMRVNRDDVPLLARNLATE